MRHVRRANVAREHLRAHHLRDAVDAKLRAAARRIPLNGSQNLFFEQRGERTAAERRYEHRHASERTRLQKTAPRQAEFPHLLLPK